MTLFQASYYLMAWGGLGGVYLLWILRRYPHLGGLRWVIGVIASRSVIGVVFNLIQAPVDFRVFSGHLTLGLAVWGLILWLHRQR